MKKSSSAKVYLYIFCAIIAYLELVDIFFKSGLVEMSGPLRYCKPLFALIVAVLELVTVHAIMTGGLLRQWRTIMKKNILGYFLVIAVAAAFIALMTVAWDHVDSLADKLRVIIASSVIVIPNLLALLQMSRNIGRK